MATAAELIAAARRAEAAGDFAATERFKAEARRVHAQERISSEQVDTGDKVMDFAAGAFNGMNRIGALGRKLVTRGKGALGFDTGDELDQINQSMLDANNAVAYRRERSPVAFGAGEIVGETAATLPVGGVGATAGKSLFNGTRMALNTGRVAAPTTMAGRIAESTAAVAGEGAAIGAYTADGENVAQNAAEGAVLDVVAGGALHLAGRTLGEMWRTVRRAPAVQRAVEESLTEANSRVGRAAVDGGYTLDGATAHSTVRSYDALEALRNDEDYGGRLALFKAQQQEQITGKARSLAEQFGPIDNLKGFETGYQPAREVLSAMRSVDEGKYKAAYAAFDRMAAETDTRLPVGRLHDNIAAFITDNVNSSNSSLAGQISKDLERYGITAAKGERLANDPYHFPKRNEPPKPLSLENVEDLIQDINAHWSPSLNEGEKRYLGAIKGYLEKHVDNALNEMGEKAGVGSQVYEMGKAAREARRSFSENWTAGDIIEKVTSRTKAGDEYAVDYSKAFAQLSGADGDKYISTIKARLLLNPDGQQAWRSMQQAPLLEALFEATKDTSQAVMEGGGIAFKVKAFEAAFNKQLKTQAAKEALYGAEGAAEIQRAIDAWKLADRKPHLGATLNTSNTAMTLITQLRFLPSGRGSKGATALVGALPVVGSAYNKGVREQAAIDMLQGGTVPASVKGAMATDISEQWEKEFVGAGGLKYGNMLRTLLRTGAVVEFTDE